MANQFSISHFTIPPFTSPPTSTSLLCSFTKSSSTTSPRRNLKVTPPAFRLPYAVGCQRGESVKWEAGEKMRPKIYLFGDSITEESFGEGGWGSSLTNYFSRTADIVLRGYSGYNTRWALRIKEKVFPPPESGAAPVAVTVFFGANDSCLPDRCSKFQHVPLDEYRQNLLAIVALLKGKWPSTRIILITPPPIDEAARLLYPFVENPENLPERTNETAGNYAKQCLRVAAECGASGIDLWTKMQQFPGWKKAYLRDGLHLTPEGNKVVYEEVISQLKEDGISQETLPADQPLISEIDPNDPLKSFDNLSCKG